MVDSFEVIFGILFQAAQLLAEKNELRRETNKSAA